MAEGRFGKGDDFHSLLISKGIRPSFQRLLILRFIMNAKNHPSAEMIYGQISKEIPTLSRTTVYNTLNLFTKKRILTILKVDDSELRYDFLDMPHAHFYCFLCKKIIDLNIKTPLYFKRDINGHQATETQISFRGICQDCLIKKGEKVH